MSRRFQTVLTVLSVALLTIVGTPRRLDAAEHQVITSLAREFGPVDVITSTGDHVVLTGTIRLVTRATILEDGFAHFALRAVLQADGAGDSGTAYRSGGVAFAELFVLDGDPNFPIDWNPDFRLRPVGSSAQAADPIRVNLTLTFSATDPGRLVEVDIDGIWVP
jgi:hypothetical protein